MKTIVVPTIKEILMEEFMKPLNMSLLELAASLNITEETLLEILDGKTKITPTLSSSLAKVFYVSDNYFLKLQEDITKRLLK